MSDKKFWGDKPYFSLDHYLKQTFGEKVYRLSLNGGMTCPNRDGTLDSRGCIFCSAGGSGDFATAPSLSVTEQITQAKERIRRKSNCKKFIAYFQAYTNTYAPVSYLIELGLQSIHNDTLRQIRSGFTYEQYLSAVDALKDRGLSVITHLILGLPGETEKMMLASVDAVAHLPVDGVKLQLLHVLKNTDLALLYEKAPFPVFSLEEYCDFVVTCIEHLPPEMVIHRLTGDGPRSLLIAPLWSTDKKRVLNTIRKCFQERDTWQGKYYTDQA